MSKRIKVLFVSFSLSCGGAERFTSTLVSHLDRSCFIPALCLFRDDITYPIPNNIPIYHLKKQTPWDIPIAVLRLRHALQIFKPHVVISSIASLSSFTYLAIVKSGIRCNWIIRVGGNPTKGSEGFLGDISKLSLRYCFRRAMRIVTNSEGLSSEVVNCFPETRNHIETILTPTDFDFIDKQAIERVVNCGTGGIPVIISVGSFKKAKRPDIMLESFTQLRKQVKAVLWICGEGPLKSQIETMAKQMGVEPYVKMLGFQKNPYKYMQLADIYLLSSDHEGLPNALIEAQGLGIPAVATRCEYGPDEIVEDGKTGILTEVGNTHEIAAALNMLLKNSKMRKEMGKAAKERARRLFDKAGLTIKWENLIKKVSREQSSN